MQGLCPRPEIQGLRPRPEMQGLRPRTEMQGLRPRTEMQGLCPRPEMQGLRIPYAALRIRPAAGLVQCPIASLYHSNLKSR